MSQPLSSLTLVRCLLLVVLVLSLPAAADYAEKYRAGLAQCRQIDRDEHQSGLFFNPDGYRSFYTRSNCLQEFAVQARDPEVCEKVRERWSLFSSSWGVSEENCRRLVREAIGKDTSELLSLRQRYTEGPHRLISLRVEQNGNGRDYDIVPTFSPQGFDHSYHVAVYILFNNQRYLLTENGFYLDGSNRIRMFEYQKDIRSRFPDFRAGQDYQLQALVTLSIGTGSYRGWWSPDFIDRHFPVPARQQSFSTTSTF